MQRALIVGVMGGGLVDASTVETAYRLGALIAQQGWFLLNGGRNAGVMDASARGAADHGGLTIGILPDADTAQVSPHIQIPICTGMGNARNIINVLSSDVVVACSGGAGTVSEIALALKTGKTVITMNFDTDPIFASSKRKGKLISVNSPEKVVQCIKDVSMASMLEVSS